MIFLQTKMQAKDQSASENRAAGIADHSAQGADLQQKADLLDTAQRVAKDDDEESLQGKFNNTAQRISDKDKEEPAQGKFTSTVQRQTEKSFTPSQMKAEYIQRETKPNNTGLPDNLKSGVESLSGYSFDNVRVHYNSSKPATVQALAYTQGTDIHVAPGEEQHLAHEAWHVAQQMAGRVAPTTSINGMPVNDNMGLEHEADVMGAKATQKK
ncbi:MAG: DUF4157 domain-containing protein [Fibrobacteraceae bacterium]